MQDILKKAKSNMAFAGAVFICAGLVFSPALQSIGVALIFLHPFFNGAIKPAFQNLIRNRYGTGLVVYYYLIVLSAFHTSNWPEYQSYVFMQLPLLLIPFGIWKTNFFSRQQLKIIFIVFILSVIITGIASFINYIIHFSEIQEQITHSKPIPIVTGVNHIYYSVLLVSSAALLQWGIFFKAIQKKSEKTAAWACLLIIIVLLHTISARTGLLCFYFEVIASVFWLMAVHGKLVAGFAILAALAILAFIAVTTIPSVKNRLANTELDLHKYASGADINHYSLSMRFAALKTAAAVFKKNPVLGVGPADVQDAMNEEYTLEKSNLIPENQKKPHNQFLYTLVSMGIIGGLVLCYIIFMPVFTGKIFKSYLFLMFIVICFIAFQAEYLLERQVGITFFCLFYIILSSTDLSVPHPLQPVSRQN
jgi:O-antigen ligase